VTYWLKGAGTSEDPLPDDWPEQSLLWRTANSPQRPTLRTEDRVVYWAVGSGRVLGDGEARFFALARVVSEPPEQCAHPRWPWKVDVEFITAVDRLSEAPRLSDINARPHRNPQIRLSDPQGEMAERLLPVVPPERLAQLVEHEVPPERRSL